MLLLAWAATAAPATFVGAASCAGCHADATAAWRGSHHDLAMQMANDTTVLGRFGGATLTTFGVTTTFTKEGGQRWFSLEPDEKIPRGDLLHSTGVAST